MQLLRGEGEDRGGDLERGGRMGKGGGQDKAEILGARPRGSVDGSLLQVARCWAKEKLQRKAARETKW